METAFEMEALKAEEKLEVERERERKKTTTKNKTIKNKHRKISSVKINYFGIEQEWDLVCWKKKNING